MVKTTDADSKARKRLRALFDVAVEAISPVVCLPRNLPRTRPAGDTLVIAIGKGAAAMTAVAVSRLGPMRGLIVTRAGHGVPERNLLPEIEVIEAGHPLPDDQSELAATRAMELARSLGPKDRMLALISGGGSALMSLPAPGVTLAEKQGLTRELLHSGATIGEINCVRKHLSMIKGGRLAVAAAPARVHTLLISDVPGDDPSYVASGPTVADSSSLEEARAIVARYAIDIPASIEAALNDTQNETPSADSLGLAGGEIEIVGRARDALAAASEKARADGYAVTNLGDTLEAESRHLGAGHAALARRMAAEGGRHAIISGGETTVTVRNPNGRGGRNLEYLLGLAIALDEAPGIWAIACDTDGIDGTQDNAGAIVTPDTLARAASLHLDAREALANNEAYNFFKALGDLVVTGPTRTNVNDFRAILIESTNKE